MLFNAFNVRSERKPHQSNRRRHSRRLLIESWQEGGMGQGVCENRSTAGAVVAY